MKTPRFSTLTVFLAGTTLSLLLAFGILALAGPGNLSGSVAEVKKELVPDALAGFNTNIISTGSMYSSNYLNWTHSTTLKADDTTAQTIDLIKSSTNSNVSMTDFNGDGLIDILYDQYVGSATYYGVFLNNGNLGTTWAYKCAVTYVSPNYHYYGDCAG